MIIDAWAQHPTLRHSRDPIFDSLRRWTRETVPTEELPAETTVRVMDAAGVAKSLISAWVAPRDVMISNDEVARFVSQYPPQLVEYLRTNGGEKVLFGTNYPMIAPAKALEGLDELGLPPEVGELFLGGNAQRVYGIGE